jgi:peptide/nickel transport system substrate-binding protein
MELKSVTPSVYFSSDAANPDTARKFYADIQMLTIGVGAPPDPEGLMRQFLSSEIAAKENKWQRTNATRWRSEAYDNLFHAAEGELDPVKRATLFIAMNDPRIIHLRVFLSNLSAAASHRLSPSSPTLSNGRIGEGYW